MSLRPLKPSKQAHNQRKQRQHQHLWRSLKQKLHKMWSQPLKRLLNLLSKLKRLLRPKLSQHLLQKLPKKRWQPPWNLR